MRPLISIHAEFTALEHAAILVAQHGKQHLVEKLGLEWKPIDIEETCVGRGRAVLKDVAPPRVGRGIGAHVVGHEVEHQPHAKLAQGSRQRREALVAAQFRIKLCVIADVVTVRAAGGGFEGRRHVEIGDSQPVQIGGYTCGLDEGHVGIELQPVGGHRDTQQRKGSRW